MHGYIYRREAHLDYTRNVRIGHIRKSDIISVDKGKTRVVILEVKRVSKPFGILIYEAEDTTVLARMLLIHKRRFEIKTYIVVFSLSNRYEKLLITAQYPKSYRGLCEIKAIVEHVVYLIIIYAVKNVARHNTVALCQGARFNTGYFYHNAFTFLLDKSESGLFAFAYLYAQ
jgi:hypothetical protein